MHVMKCTYRMLHNFRLFIFSSWEYNMKGNSHFEHKNTLYKTYHSPFHIVSYEMSRMKKNISQTISYCILWNEQNEKNISQTISYCILWNEQNEKNISQTIPYCILWNEQNEKKRITGHFILHLMKWTEWKKTYHRSFHIVSYEMNRIKKKHSTDHFILYVMKWTEWIFSLNELGNECLWNSLWCISNIVSCITLNGS